MAWYDDLLEKAAPYGGAIIGGLLGAAGGGDTQTTTSASKDPWAPAQPYILDNLKNEAALQKQYQQTPFNAQQIKGYSNLFGDIGNFRDNVMPGLMDFANKGMTSSYHRATGGAVGSGGGYGGPRVEAGMTQSGTGPFSVAQGAGQRSTGVNGLLDLNGAQNPYKNGSMPVTTTASAMAPANAVSGGLLGNGVIGGGGSQNGGIGMNGTPSDGTTSGNIYGIGSSFDTDKASSIFAKASMLGVPVAAISAFIAGISSGQMTQEQIDAEVASLDKALAEKDARNHPDSSYGLNTSFGGSGYGGPGTGNGNGGGSNDRGTGNQRD